VGTRRIRGTHVRDEPRDWATTAPGDRTDVLYCAHAMMIARTDEVNGRPTLRVVANSPNVFAAAGYLAARPVMGGRSLSVTIPGGAATTAGTAFVTGIAV
jgi:hypothetical protein